MMLFEFLKGIFPYLLCVPLGYWLSRKEYLPKAWVTVPMLYVLMPVLIVNHVLKAEAESLKILPLMGFLLALGMLLPAHFFHRFRAPEAERGLIQSSFSFYNVAFFGIPTVLALFGPDSVTLLICIYIGTALYGDIIGFYQVAKSTHTMRQALLRVFKIPFVYAFLLAAGLRWGDISSPDWLSASAKAFGVAVSIGGMLIIGMNLTEVNFKRLNKRFLAEMMGIRLVAGVLLTGLLLFLERQFFGWLEEESLHMMALLPLFPIAANVTLFASYLDADEGATATWVLVSMLLSLLLIPLASLFF